MRDVTGLAVPFVVLAGVVLLVGGAASLTLEPAQARHETPTWRGWWVGSVGPGSDITQHTAALFHGDTVTEVPGWSVARWSDPVRGLVVLDRWEQVQGDLGPYQRHVETSGPIWLWELEASISHDLADITTASTNPGDSEYLASDGKVDFHDLSTFIEHWVVATGGGE